MHQFADFRVPAVCAIHIQDMFSIVEKLSLRIQADPFNAIEGFSYLEKIILRNEDRVCFRQFFKLLSCMKILHINGA